MILVDTSVWSLALRRRPDGLSAGQRLVESLDAATRAAGVRCVRQRPARRRRNDG